MTDDNSGASIIKRLVEDSLCAKYGYSLGGEFGQVMTGFGTSLSVGQVQAVILR